MELTDKYEWLDTVGNLLLFGYLLGDDIVEAREVDFPDEVDAVIVLDPMTKELKFVDAEEVWA